MGNRPIKKFKAGLVQASVFENVGKADSNGEERTYKTVQLERRYLDAKDNEWKSTNTLHMNDIPRARLLLDEAFRAVVLKDNNYTDCVEEVVA